MDRHNQPTRVSIFVRERSPYSIWAIIPVVGLVTLGWCGAGFAWGQETPSPAVVSESQPQMANDKTERLLESRLVGTDGNFRVVPARPISPPTNTPVPDILTRNHAEASQSPLNPALPTIGSAAAPDSIASPQMVMWLKQLVRDNLPDSYEDTKKWGHQKEVWDGVDVHREGLNIKTKRKHKLVNDGTWTRYKLQIVDPDRNVHVHFHRLEEVENGRIAFDVTVELLLDAFGRLSQWVRDVQVISLSINADAVCSLRVSGTVALQMNPLKFPPDVMIRPHVDQATVHVSYFRVRRISQLHGPLAEQLGNGLKGILDDKVAESNEKLVEKIHRQLNKHQDRMVFSMQEWLQSKLALPSTEPASAVPQK